MPEGRPAFVFDGERCTACEACRIACGIANATGADTGWRQVLTLNPRRHPALPTRHLSLACNHCEDPACLAGCPAAAYRQDPLTGAVLLDQGRCLGCRYCSWVCPYDAPRFDASQGVMGKCTFCQERLAGGGEPACTQACPTGALSLGKRSAGGAGGGYPGLLDTGLGPALVLAPARKPFGPPRAAPVPAATALPPLQPQPPRKITLHSEWGLLVFTVVMPALAAWLAAGVLRTERGPALSEFLALGALAMGAAASHLGRPLRAWRALANLQQSWLSREVLAASSFLALGSASLLAPPIEVAARPLAWLSVLAGAGLCAAIDGVYRAIPRLSPARLHGGEATLAAPFLLALMAGAWEVAVVLGVVRSLLAVRRLQAGAAGLPAAGVAARLALLAIACVPALPWPVATIVALAGEVLDRCDLLAGLEPASPARVLVMQAAPEAALPAVAAGVDTPR